MKKNKISYMLLLVALMIVSLVSCQKKEASPTATVTKEEAKEVVEQTGSYQDGIYFASEDSFASNGWKYVVTLTVENGKIVKANWDGVNISAGPSKKAVDKAGKYNMKKFGGAQAEWSEQAAKAEKYLIDVQDPSVVKYSDEDGHTDDIAGVSIHVVEFFELAQKALNNGPVGKGMYQDGTYFMADSEFASSGWKSYVSLTVINGNIVGANWSAINRLGQDKKLYDAAGKYNMVKFGGAQAEWSEQATKAEQYLISIQDPSKVEYSDAEGHTDAISGVSIHISDFISLADAALKAGPVTIGPYNDGGYYSTKDTFENGWKEYVSLFVKNGNIVDVYWSAVNEAGDDKKAFDMEGNYNMVKFGGAQAEWYEQAALAEQHLIKTQDVSAISYKDDAGHTDDIAGVSIHVSSFYQLVEAALNNGVVTIE